MEPMAGDGGAWHLSEHFDGADGARSEHGALARREYELQTLEALEASEASEALERGLASAGPAAG